MGKWYCCPKCEVCFEEKQKCSEHVMTFHHLKAEPRVISAGLRSQYDSIERLRLLLKEGYWIHRVLHPHTTNGSVATTVELVKGRAGCTITAFDEEAQALSEFAGVPLPAD